MAGAGQNEIVFLSVVLFFCEVDDVLRRVAAVGNSQIFRLHGLALASLRQARHMEPRIVERINISLLRIRAAFREVQLGHARWSYRVAMSYVRLAVVFPTYGAFLAPPPPLRALGETDANVAVMVANASVDFQRALTRGVPLDIWDPPSPTTGSEGESEEAASEEGDLDAGEA
jgi:hypothetical protein